MNKLLRYSFIVLMTMIGLNVSAQDVTLNYWLVDCTMIVEDSTIIDNDLLTVSTPDGISYGAVKGGTADVTYMDATGNIYNFTNYLYIALKGVPEESYPNGYFTDYRSSLVVTAKENIKLTGFYQVANDKHIIVVDKEDYSTNLEAAELIVTENEENTIAAKTYELQKGHSYVLYSKNLSMQFYGLKYEKNDASEPDVKMGDVNNDGDVDVTDVVMIIDRILNKDPKNFNERAADVNNDGDIDVTDVVLVIDAILGKVTLGH